MLGTSFGNVELLEGAKELYTQSEVKRLQNFYGLSFKDLFKEDIMEQKGVKGKDLDYILAHRETEATIKSKEAWEMKRGLFESKRWIKLAEHYGLKERDIRNIEQLKKMGVGQDDINFIIGKEEDKEEIKTKSSLEKLKEQADSLGIKFNPNIGEVKLLEKIETFNLTKDEQ